MWIQKDALISGSSDHHSLNKAETFLLLIKFANDTVRLQSKLLETRGTDERDMIERLSPYKSYLLRKAGDKYHDNNSAIINLWLRLRNGGIAVKSSVLYSLSLSILIINSVKCTEITEITTVRPVCGNPIQPLTPSVYHTHTDTHTRPLWHYSSTPLLTLSRQLIWQQRSGAPRSSSPLVRIDLLLTRPSKWDALI